MVVNDVALSYVVGPPDRIEDLIAGHDATCAACQEVDEALLDRRQLDAVAHLSIDDVDLKPAERDRRNDRPVCSRRATGDDDGPGEQFLRGEGHREDVVHTEVERLELRCEVTPAR